MRRSKRRGRARRGLGSGGGGEKGAGGATMRVGGTGDWVADGRVAGGIAGRKGDTRRPGGSRGDNHQIDGRNAGKGGGGACGEREPAAVRPRHGYGGGADGTGDAEYRGVCGRERIGER